MNTGYYKNLIYNAELKIVAVITSSVLNRADKRSVMRQVKKIIQNVQHLNDNERHSLWLFAMNFYKHTVAGAARKVDADDRAASIYAVLRDDTPMLEKIKNDVVDNIEYRKKHEELVDVLQGDSKFYYCTEFTDPAKDHAAYQGRIYYKKNAEYSDEEKAYIFNAGLLSVDEVMLQPPYLCTRKNCRHRLIPVSFAEIGRLRRVSAQEYISYEVQQYRFYRDRLKLMQVVKKSFGDASLPLQMKTDMRRTRKLMQSWRNRAINSKK